LPVRVFLRDRAVRRQRARRSAPRAVAWDRLPRHARDAVPVSRVLLELSYRDESPLSARTGGRPMREALVPDVGRPASPERSLSWGTKTHGIDAVPRIPVPSADAFATYVRRHQPVIISGALEEWPARHWSAESLKAAYGEHPIPV